MFLNFYGEEDCILPNSSKRKPRNAVSGLSNVFEIPKPFFKKCFGEVEGQHPTGRFFV